MKLVFKNEAERREKSAIIMEASSISNSQSLMALLKDSVVDGSEPEPVEEVKKKTPEQEYETLEMLIEKARSMGVNMDFANASRAGVLKAMEDFGKAPEKEEEEEELLDEGSEVEESSELQDKPKENTMGKKKGGKKGGKYK